MVAHVLEHCISLKNNIRFSNTKLRYGRKYVKIAERKAYEHKYGKEESEAF
ncbi:hypothetical protein ACT7DA_03845 [Bacillus pacificus]